VTSLYSSTLYLLLTSSPTLYVNNEEQNISLLAEIVAYFVCLLRGGFRDDI